MCSPWACPLASLGSSSWSRRWDCKLWSTSPSLGWPQEETPYRPKLFAFSAPPKKAHLYRVWCLVPATLTTHGGNDWHHACTPLGFASLLALPESPDWLNPGFVSLPKPPVSGASPELNPTELRESLWEDFTGWRSIPPGGWEAGRGDAEIRTLRRKVIPVCCGVSSNQATN